MKYYFLGIGGVSMSALAVMLKHEGNFVRGSDEAEGQGVDIARRENILVDFDVNSSAIAESDIVVFSSAIKGDDQRMQIAKNHNKKLLSRGQLLGEIASKYKNVIAVAGSHGKTTTTALIFEILSLAGFDPTLHLGGYRCEDDLNYHLGGKDFFVTEACEYHNNFLYLHPTISVITNIEKEHMDFFENFSNEKNSFRQFEEQSQFVFKSFCDLRAAGAHHDENGGLIFNLERTIPYPKEFDAKDKKWQKNRANLDKKGQKIQKIMSVHMKICEEVNKENAIYAYLVAKKLGVSDEIIKKAFERFCGVRTRFERKKCPFFDICFCDYAHHPTEIEKAILTAKKIFKNKELLVVFQPHTYSRTKSLLHEFVSLFEKLDMVVLYKTYSARESPQDGISSMQLSEILQKRGKKAFYFENFQDLQSFFSDFSKNETAILFVGAGDLPRIAHQNGFFE